MICVAISHTKAIDCLHILDQVEMAEIRLDLNAYTQHDIKQIFAHKTPTIATCRPDSLGFKKQEELLILAIEAGANFVDIEIEAPRELQKRILALAKAKGCRVIVSYHNYKSTPGLKELYTIADECFELGADIAKLATMSHSKRDNARILALYSMDKPIVSLGMGFEGKPTRLIAPLLGAEFTFASMDSGEETAPGQIKYSNMKESLQTITNTLKD